MPISDDPPAETEPAAPASGGWIDLSHVGDFDLGEVRVRPARCDVVRGAIHVRLQPRVMQVLVALAQASGEPVSREALIERCWRGLVVGDDALNRCVQRLRRMAESEAAGAFIIETLPKIGYRLVASADVGSLASRSTGAGVRSWRGAHVWAAATVVLVCIAGAAWAAWSLRPRQWVLEQTTMLASTPLIERHPAISPDGRTIAYSAGTNIAGRRIYLRRIAGGDAIPLTGDGYDDAAPAWSPDGARIAYIAFRTGEPCRIMIVSARGGSPREAGRCLGEERSRAVWAPTGDALFFVDSAAAGGQDRIVRLDLRSGKRSEMTHAPFGRDDSEPEVSPDGRWIVFPRRITDDESQLVIRDLNTGAEKVVVQLPLDDAGYTWTMDSRALFVATERKGWGSDIRTYPIDGGRPSDVTSTLELLGRLSSGPRGLLAAEVFNGRMNVTRPPDRDGAAPVIVDPANGATWSPAFSPIGVLAMVSNRSGDCAIWVMKPGEPARELKSLGSDCGGQLTWSPDGARLAFVAKQRENYALRVINAAGADLFTISVPVRSVGPPAWTADGDALLFSARDATGWRLWRVNLARPTTRIPISGYGWITVQAKGDTLYGVKAGEPGIWRLGSQPQLVTRKLPKEQPFAWTIVGDEVVFNDSDDQAHQRLRAAPLSGGPDRPFASTPKSNYSMDFAVDPRSGTPVYISDVNRDSDIVLFRLARR